MGTPMPQPHRHLLDPAAQQAVVAVAQAVTADRWLSFPWYQDGLRSSTQAQEEADGLPVLYCWGEELGPDGRLSFTVSANVGALARMLERLLPRGHPGFAAARDALADLLGTAQGRALQRLCAEFGTSPSRLSRRLAGGGHQAYQARSALGASPARHPPP